MKVDIKARAKQLKTDIPAVFVALQKKETPLPAKILAILTVGYALSPIDFIPDFIPVLGYVDDIFLLPFLVAFTLKLIPNEVLSACRKEAEGLWENGKPKKWIYALLIIIIWILIIFGIIKVLC